MTEKKTAKEYLVKAIMGEDLDALDFEFRDLLFRDAKDRLDAGIDEPGQGSYAKMFPELHDQYKKRQH
jgi:hypothetical protein